MRVIIVLLICGLGWVTSAWAQGQRRGNQANSAARPFGTLPVKNDTTQRQKSTKGDSLRLSRQDSLWSKEGALKTKVKYTSRDSTIMEDEGNIVTMYGEAKVEYEDIKLEADYIRLDYTKNEIFAKGTLDSTRKKVGFPVFTQGGTTYNADSLRYNFKSKKAIIKAVVTQQGEGFVQGKNVKKDQDDNLYLRKGLYTTCDLAHPHFYIASSKLKLANNPKKGTKQVISGPFNLVIADIPLPIGLPFGYFPVPKQKEIGTSGIIMPTYGEEPNGRGFFLRDGGYYFAVNEHIGMQLLGQIYSKGGWGLGVQSSYKKRYSYNGSLNIQFNHNTTGDEANRNPTNDFRIQWSHTPESRGNRSFSASVNASTNGFGQRNSFDSRQYLSSAFGSSVSYNMMLGNIGRAGASLRLNQNVATRQLDASTDFNFGINQFQPFKRRNAVSSSFLDQFRMALDFSGSFSATNRISPNTSLFPFKVKVANPDTRYTKDTTLSVNFSTIPEILRFAKFTGRYNVPLTLPNFKVFKYINVTPGFSYQGELFTTRYSYKYMAADTAIRIDTTRGLFTTYSYGFNVSANTRLYGTVYFSKLKIGRLEAIRHTMAPSISFNASPDFSGENFGFFQRVQVNQKGDFAVVSRYNGLSSAPGPTGSVGFSLQNNFEMKLRSKTDTAAKQFEKIPLLDNLSMSGSYNLLADSLKMSDIAMNATANILKKFNVNLSATYDPYLYIAEDGYTQGKKINTYLLSAGKGFAQLKSAYFSVGTSFRPPQKKEKKVPPGSAATEEQAKFVQQHPDMYVDFDVPWSLNLSYQWSYNKTYLVPGKQTGQSVSSITLSGDLSLTSKWKVTFSSGYDFVNKAVTYSQIGMQRMLHCWVMEFNWTPAAQGARANTYSFDLRVQSSLLKDLKISRRRTFYDRGVF
ncbi:MAG: putative LPS assembly protein LptD [Spirosomataceae bacterium]